ncbi:MAG: phosphate ABC transporter substrate-binding protein PstS [Acidobacteriota bacterium]
MKRTVLAVGMILSLVGFAQAQHLTGAGSTFDYPIFAKWFAEYSAAHPGVQINYQSIGSGGGIQQFCNGLVDFGASDMPLTDDMIAKCKVKLIHIPIVLGAVAPIYNVPGVTNLRFSGETLANIYLGKITNWDDKAIADDNPGVKLPNQKINVVHRSEASGTSFIWTDYLSKVSKAWASGPGKGTAIGWPVGVGGKGSEGVSAQVSQFPGSIGYVELIYALQNHISVAPVKNSAGKWVTASIASTTAAAASVKEMPKDLRVSITNPPGDDAYPIASFSWIIAPQQDTNSANGKVLMDLLSWCVKSGQSESSSLDYAPLPQNVAQKDLDAIYSMK